MNSRKRRAEMLRALCAGLHPDDGVDPRNDKRRDTPHDPKADRKVRQLCAQARQALQLAIDMLPQAVLGLQLRDVVPAPNAGRLRAVVAVSDPQQRTAAEALLARFAGRLRTEVAGAIARRRAPELVFEVIIDDGEGADHG